MSIRRLIVEVDHKELNVAEFCRQHGVSTWFFWNLRRRYAKEGPAALEVRSRAPNRVANKTSAEVEDQIVAKRKELSDAGLDAGPGTIWFHLQDLEGLPSESSIWRILKTRGFITADPSKAPKPALRRFVAEHANECWQLDDTSWELDGGIEAKILNVIDDHSREVPASDAMSTVNAETALQTMAGAARHLGWPQWFLSDNARAFCGPLAKALEELGIAHVHSRPYHPQTCGKVERFHQTQKKWLAKQPRAHSIAELQAQLDIFRHIYNHQRPHRGIGRRLPAEVWSTAPKTGPAQRPLGADASTIKATKVNRNGVLNAGGYAISVGTAHAKAEALVIITGTDCHVFIGGKLARQLTIDPTRAAQPLYSRRGRPATVRDVSRQP